MGLPKYRRSRQRRDTGRAHKKLYAPTYVECPNCKSMKLPHHICPSCGFYKGQLIVEKH